MYFNWTHIKQALINDYQIAILKNKKTIVAFFNLISHVYIKLEKKSRLMYYTVIPLFPEDGF